MPLKSPWNTNGLKSHWNTNGLVSTFSTVFRPYTIIEGSSSQGGDTGKVC